MKRSNKFLLFLICCQFFLSSILAEDNKYAFTEAHVELSNEIIQILENYHFTKKKYASIKKEALDSYIDRLDPGRSIFLQKEVDSFFIENNNDDPYDQRVSLGKAFKIFDLYRSRYIQRYTQQKEMLSEIESMDLKQNRKILKNRS